MCFIKLINSKCVNSRYANNKQLANGENRLLCAIFILI